MKRLLIRFDDLSPYTNMDIINEIKTVCKKYKSAVLLCIIPFCEDKNLIENNTNNGDKFWEAMLYCQEQNSILGLHGYKHVLWRNKSRQIFPISMKTEFCGLKEDIQRNMIKKGRDFLEKKGLNIRFFAAPAHSMDQNTVKVLKELNIKVVSDGFFSECTLWKGIKWLPLKSWKETRKFIGPLSTICKHPKEKKGGYKFKLEININQKLTSFEEEITSPIKFSMKEYIFHNTYSFIFIIYRFLRKLRNKYSIYLGNI